MMTSYSRGEVVQSVENMSVSLLAVSGFLDGERKANRGYVTGYAATGGDADEPLLIRQRNKLLGIANDRAEPVCFPVGLRLFYPLFGA